MPIKICISSRLSTGNWYWIRYDLIAAMMKSYHLDQQISNLSSLPSRARSLSTLPACRAPGNAMEKSWKSASLTAQPNFHRKKQNIMFHFPCWNKTTQIKIKIKKHPGVKAPHLHIELESLKGQWPSVHSEKKKKIGFDSDGRDLRNCARAPRPPTWTQGATKNIKRLVLRNNTFGWSWIFSMLKGKRLEFLGWLFFLDDFLLLRMIFESYLFERFGSFWMIFFWKGWISKAGRPPWEVVVSW